MKTSLEQYVEQLGIMGTLSMLRVRIASERDANRREFFLTCQSLLIRNRGGRLLEAEQRYQERA